MTGPEHGEHPLSEGDDEPWAEGPAPPGDSDESWVEGWDEGWGDEEGTEDDDAAPAWRRPLIVGVSVVTALALALIPLYNVIFARTVADNGLEVCGFDYCVVQEAVRAAGLDLTMSALANTYLDEEESRALAGELTDYLGIDPVGLRVVPDLDGRLGGVYDPSNRSIAIESPARAWTVLHEVAHAVETGHGEDFVDVVIELAAWLEKTPS